MTTATQENRIPQTAFLFPGQGSQVVGMGKELAQHHPVARQTLEEADHALGLKISLLCFEGREDELRLTENTQPAILAASVAAWRVLHEKGITPHSWPDSLLEYPRMWRPVLAFADAVRTVRVAVSSCRMRFRSAQDRWQRFWECPRKPLGVCRDAAQSEVCESANINSQADCDLWSRRGG